MSAGGAVGRREVAVRCFAAEYDDASLEYSESDEERAPNYVVTPTGARINRLFVVGVLTEVEAVSNDVLRGRVVDPTGAFVVYAGQYQPDAKTALERAEPPTFVAVTGKARTFEPDDADRVYTSIRPESVNVVDAATRDRWTVQAAEQTIERVATFAAALERDERGQALTAALRESGVDPALASGIPRAVDHYGTTRAYLAAVRELALQAAAVVADEREEVEPLDLAPDEGGSVGTDLTGGVSIESAVLAAGGASSSPASAESAETAEEAVSESGTVETASTDVEAESAAADETSRSEPAAADTDSEPVDAATAADEDGGESSATDSAGDDLGDFDDFGADEETVDTTAETDAAAGNGAAESGPDEAPASDELYEMDEEERAAVEEEFGTEFSTGSEVDDPGEADIETPGPDTDARAEQADEAVGTADNESTDTDAPETTPDDAEADAGDVDLVDATVDVMGELDDGNGARREAVIEAVVADHGVEADAVEDAIQEALMGGRCYEPDDEHVKAI